MERNNSVYFRLSKILCGFKDQVRARPSGEKCGLELAEGKALSLPASPDQTLTITTAGEEVLAGKRNWLDSLVLDRWMGGVHLTSSNSWCWNPVSASLSKLR